LIKKLIYIYILFILAINAKGQYDYSLDSVIQLINISADDTNKLILLSIIAENGDENIWPIYNNEMGKLASKLVKSQNKKIAHTAKKYLAAAFNNKGYYFNDRGIAYKAIIFFNKSLTIQREIGDKEGEAYSLNNLGAIYDSKGDINKSLENYFSALRIRENLGDKRALAQTYNNIAILYNKQNDIYKCLNYHYKSLKMRQELNDEASLAIGYNNLGTTYAHIIEKKISNNQPIEDTLITKSLEYYLKAKTYNEKSNDSHGIALSIFNIADHYIIQADYYYKNNEQKYDSIVLEAKKLFNQSLTIFMKWQEKEWIANTQNRLADCSLRLKKYNDSEMHGEKAMKLAIELGYPTVIENSANILRKVYYKNKQFEKALYNTDLYYKMRDSVINKKTENELLSKYYLYQNEKQELQNKAKQEKMELEYQSKTKQQKIIIYFTVIALVLIALFGIFIYNRFKHSQKQNTIIQHQKTIVEESRKEIVDSINYAKRIQYALLANQELVKRNLQHNFILFKPKDIVSGDFYWATEYNNKFYLAVCDCTGHGVPGAFMSLLSIGFLSEAIKEKNIGKPNEIFNYVRTRLIESISVEGQQDGMDGVLICLNKETNQLTYAAANNEPILISDGKIIELPKDRMPVGKGERQEDFKLHTVNLKTTDTLYLYTDGYADQFGGTKGKKFKYKQLNELLLSVSDKPLSKQKEKLDNIITEWRGNLEQVDDICVIGIKI
jgi:serine phosphatase RsbU (regulator of sigma subunit)/tetratricopeptide (TPR) repeat protein